MQGTDGKRFVLAPTHCPNGHRLGPNRTLVGTKACQCLTRHMSWFCRICGATTYAPELGPDCSAAY